jgi:hypothetical protein
MALGRDDDRHRQSGEHPDSKAIDHEHSMPVTVGRWWPVCGRPRGVAIKETLDDVIVVELLHVDLRMEVQSQPCIGEIATRPSLHFQ